MSVHDQLELAFTFHWNTHEFFGEWRRIEQLDLATMQRASPSPAEFTVSHPYVFSFYFVPRDRRRELARLARLP